MEAFSKALRAIPITLAENGGFDSSDLVARLRAAHHSGQKTMGLDMFNGSIADMETLKVTESLQCKLQVLVSAHEAAEMILRVDDIIRAAPRYGCSFLSLCLLMHSFFPSFLWCRQRG